jgi:hypothetical protein
VTLKHNDIHFARWREVQVALQDYKLSREQAAADALDRLEEQVVQEQRATAQPRPRRYVLTPQ